jgi:multidrug resistance efflux pump
MDEQNSFAQENTAPVSETTKTQRKIFQNKAVRSGLVLALALILAGGLLYYVSSTFRVTIADSLVQAPEIGLSPDASGVLDDVYVQEGDRVPAYFVVAKVGDDLVKTKVAGIIISVQNDIGKTYAPGQAVVTMIDPTQLRIVGTIDENKGLSKIAVGQLVSFTVDAFGSKRYEGVVDGVSPTSHQTGVVFNISGQRPTQQFDIKVRFNPQKYPELKNGMSAKMTIFVK